MCVHTYFDGLCNCTSAMWPHEVNHFSAMLRKRPMYPQLQCMESLDKVFCSPEDPLTDGAEA